MTEASCLTVETFNLGSNQSDDDGHQMVEQPIQNT